MLKSVPMELNSDHTTLLQVASQRDRDLSLERNNTESDSPSNSNSISRSRSQSFNSSSSSLSNPSLSTSSSVSMTGCISFSYLKRVLPSWDNHRIKQTLDLLLSESMIWIDYQTPANGIEVQDEVTYWFPALSNSTELFTYTD
jgi:hypothetical protein